MNCPACGKANAENSAFCEQCGTRMPGQPAVNPGPPAPGPTPVTPFPFPGPPATPPPSSQAGAAASALIASMTMGEKISGAGAVAAAVGFFLPWASIAGVASENGLDLAKAASSVYLTLLVALAAAGLCYMSSKATAGKKLVFAGYLVLIGGLGPPILLSLVFGSPLLSSAGIGLWLVGLGYTAIAAGGLMTIREFSKRTF